MDIVKEKIDDLNAVVKVRLTPDDYQVKVDSALKEYSKKVQMPGFRPGKVPVGMVRKMYGKSILAEELNKLLNDSLYKYLSENNIEILGNPLPAKNEEVIDWDNQKEFEFRYDIGLAPEFSLELSKKDVFTWYKARIDDELVNKYVGDVARRYGKLINPETSEEKDWITADIVELDAAGEIVPGGVFKTSSVFTERLKNPDFRKALCGLNADAKITLDTALFSDEDDTAYFAQLLQVPADKIRSSSFRFTVKNINRLNPAEVNQELFDKVYGAGEVNSEEEFRNRIREELQRMFSRDSDQRFRNDVKKALLAKFNLSLPDEFLKRWIMTVNDKPVTAEQVDDEYSSYSEQLKWQLIENRILKEHKVVVTADEALDFASGFIRSEFNRVGKQQVSEEEVKKIASNLLTREEEAKKIYNQVYDRKLLALYKEVFTLQEKEVPYEELFKE